MTTRNSSAVAAGITAMLQHSLKLTKGQDLLVITESGYEDETEALSKVAARHGIEVTVIVLNIDQQIRFDAFELLPATLRGAIERSDAMMILFDYAAASTPCRMALLQAFTNYHRHRRAASMPGVRLAQFPYAAANFTEIDELTDLLGTALLRTRKISVRTLDTEGMAHSLTFSIGSRPTMCGSEI
jgi:hypothetical protein